MNQARRKVAARMMLEIKSRIALLWPKQPHKYAMHADPHYAWDLFCVLTTVALAAAQNKALRSINSSVC